MADGSVIQYRGKRGVVWRIKYRDASGKQVMETVGGAADGFTRKMAEAELRERLVRVERKGYRKPKPLTFGEWSKTWLAEGEARRGWASGTVSAYKGVLDRNLGPYFDGMRLGSIRPRDVAAYIRQQLKHYSPATVDLDVTVGHDICKVAVREELLDSNPFAGAERPKIVQRKWRILEPVEVQRVLKAFNNEQARTIFLTLSLTGLRRKEISGLRWRDVDLVGGVLRVEESKTKEGERSVALSSRLTEALIEHLGRSTYTAPDDRVFGHRTRGTKLNPDWYGREFRKALLAVGITDYVRPFHDARHGSLTNGAANGESTFALMRRAGHKNVATTQRYVDLAGVVFREEADSLEDRMLGAGRKFYPSEPISPDLASPESAEPSGFPPHLT